MKSKFRVIVIAGVLSLNACAMMPEQNDQVKPQAKAENKLNQNQLRQAVLDALRAGKTEQAKNLAEELVLADPKSASSHFLLALSYHGLDDTHSLSLASSGYNAARQFSGQNVWVNYLAGVTAMQQHNAQQALEFFSTAALNNPDNSYVFEGLAAAAYYSGKTGLAELAATRARQLAPNSPIAWRILTLTVAAQGNREKLDQLFAKVPHEVGGTQLNWVRNRSQNLLRTANIDVITDFSVQDKLAGNGSLQDSTTDSNQSSGLASTQEVNTSAKQLAVDVTLILSDRRRSSEDGVNLLDGLQGVFGYSDRETQVKISDSVLPTSRSTTRTITRGIGIPDITYNLNIFNRGNRYYEAIARPSLTAYVGEPSSFFIGDQLNVNVSGVQSAQIEKINVGVSMKITPSQIREDGARFQIEVDRSFLSNENAGTFTQSVGTFRQTVSATADIKFGETLILSGLSESVGDGAISKTPLIGDIPVINNLFSRRTHLDRARSAIVLVTPTLPTSIARTAGFSPATQRLLTLWDSVIEPIVGGDKLVERIQHMPVFTRSAFGDMIVSDLKNIELKTSVLDSLNQYE